MIWRWDRQGVGRRVIVAVATLAADRRAGNGVLRGGLAAFLDDLVDSALTQDGVAIEEVAVAAGVAGAVHHFFLLG